MAVVIRGVASAGASATTTSLTRAPGVPGGTAVGDMLFLVGSFGGGSTSTVSTPAGWTAIFTPVTSQQTNLNECLFGRIADGTATDSPTLTIASTAETFAASCIALGGTNGVLPTAGASSAVVVLGGASSTTETYPAITPKTASDLLVYFTAIRDTTLSVTISLVQPSGGGGTGGSMVTQSDICSFVSGAANTEVGVITQQLTAATAVSQQTSTIAAASSCVTIAVVVTPSAVPGDAPAVRLAPGWHPGAGLPGLPLGVPFSVPLPLDAGAVSVAAGVTGVAAAVAVASPAGVFAGSAGVTGVGAPVPVAAPAGAPSSAANLTGIAAPVPVAAPAGVPFGSSPNANVTGVAAAVTVAAPAGTPSGGATVAGHGRVGVFLSPAAMGEPSYSQAVTDWGTWTGDPVGVSRQYYALSSFPTADANLTYDAAHGIKCCIDLRPAYNPTSATDLANLATMLAAWKTAGLAAEVSLWAEPFNNGLSSAQYIAMVAYYGPTVRTYYPLVFCTSALSVQNNSENTYYPGDSAVDKIATDLYAIRWLTGTTLDAPASIADSAVPPKPFGLWECGAAPQGSTLLVGDTATFEVTNSTWTGAGNATTPRSTLQAHTGTGSLAITSVASGTMDAAHCAGANIATQGLPCVPGDQIACSAWVRAATSARTVQAGANFYTSGGAFVSSLFDTVHGITDSTSAWNQVTGTVTAPATAAFCRLDIRVLATGGAAEVHYADDCSLGNLNTGQSQADVTSYYGYIQAYFATRAATSKANADLIQFNSGGASGANAPIVTPVLGPADFRVALFQSLYTALDGPLSGAAVPVLGGAGTLSSAASITGVAAAVTAQGGAGTAAGAGATNVTGVAAPVAVAAPAGAVSAGVAVTGSGAPAVVAAPAGTAAGAGKIIGVGAPVTVAAPAGTAASSVNVTGAAPVTAAAPAGTAAAGASITGTAAPVTVAAPAGVAFGSSPNANVTGVAAAVTVAAPAGVPSAAGKVTGTGAPAAVAGGQGTASAPAAVTGSAAHVTAASPAGTTASAASVTGTGAPVLAAAPAGTLAAAAATAGLAALVTALGGTGTPAVGGATVKATSVATVTARDTSTPTVTGPVAGATVTTRTTHTATVTDPRDGTPAVTTAAAHTATVS